MKKTVSILALIFMGIAAQAQSSKYMDAMSKALSDFDSAQTTDQFTAIANKFERIAQAEKDQWLPYYYAGLAKATMSFMVSQTDPSKVDGILDNADKLIAKADSLMPNNSEIYVLKAMAASGRIMVNPQSRGMQYGMQSSALLSKAIQFDENNPRAYLLQGQSLFYTPEAFGGGKDKACIKLNIAAEKYAGFKPESAIAPNWGKETLDSILPQCGTTK